MLYLCYIGGVSSETGVVLKEIRVVMGIKGHKPCGRAVCGPDRELKGSLVNRRFIGRRRFRLKNSGTCSLYFGAETRCAG
jgi:hypothetical protein